MSHETVFNRYDVRGEYPEEIDEGFAERFGKAIGTYARDQNRATVVVSHDTREHSKAIYAALKDGLEATGITVIDIELGPTDRLGMAAQHYGGLGVMVTASHHSWERTGFKIVYEQGYGIGNEDLETIKNLYREESFRTGDGNRINERYEFDETYIETVRAYMDEMPNAGGTVVLDCANGATSAIAPMLFEECGFDVITLHDATTGGGIAPEPKPSNRDDLEATVEEHDAAIGLAFDPDGDRVLIYHPEHGWLDGNEVGYLLASLTDSETITASLDSSPLLEEAGEVTYTRVGDVFVSAEGYDGEADLLVEPNGHYAVTELAWYNSGTITGLILAGAHKAIPDLLDDAPEAVTRRDSIAFDSDDAVEDAVAEAIKYGAQEHEIVSTKDGVKIDTGETSILVRPSGTSTKVRIVVNGEEIDVVEASLETIKERITSF